MPIGTREVKLNGDRLGNTPIFSRGAYSVCREPHHSPLDLKGGLDLRSTDPTKALPTMGNLPTISTKYSDLYNCLKLRTLWTIVKVLSRFIYQGLSTVSQKEVHGRRKAGSTGLPYL